MSTIIAGRFEQQDQTEKTVAKMVQAGFSQNKISTFYVNPSGQHDCYPIGGDRNKSPGAEQSDKGVASGAVIGGVVGIVSMPVLGPVGTLVGAHIGGLVGALATMKDNGNASRDSALIRKSGLLLAVVIPEAASEASAITILHSMGATDLERAEGTIENGDWNDFDPLIPPTFLENKRVLN